MKKYKKIIIYILIFIFSIVFLYNIFPYFLKVELKNIPYSHIVYDENNIELGEIVVDGKYRHLEKNLGEFPEFLKKSIVTIEDRRFYQNSGIDYISLFRAVKNNLIGNGNIEGASTISTQVIRNSYWLNKDRGIVLKLKEFALSLALNKKYSKDKILEYYLNNINFGYLNYGFESASRYYFGKEINNLTKAEIITLITIIKNPNKYNPINNSKNFKQRFEILANYLEKNGIISKWEKENILNEKLIFKKGFENKLPYVVDFFKTQKLSGNKVKTTINYNLTKEIEEIGNSTIRKLQWRNVGDYSVIVIDKKTNELKVMIGGYDYGRENGQVNSVLALRQPGSTLKPFLYALAFEKLGLNKESTITDLPVQYPTKDGNIYSPKNYSLDYKGEITLAESLSQSINIPAVKLLNRVGIDNFLEFLKDLHISTLREDADYYGLSLALGSGEVSLYELTRAYSLFANNGKICDIVLFKEGKSNCKEIIGSKYTKEVFDILTNKYFKIESFPINSNLDFGTKEVFAKTGTSRNFKDNWIIGFTNNYIIGVWAGNKDGSDMKGVSGVSGAGDIFKKIVDKVKTTENPNSSKIIENKSNFLEITSPLSGSIFQIEKSIPKDSQKIKISYGTNIEFDEKRIFLNGKLINDEYINIFDYIGSNSLKVEIYKDGSLAGSDEVWFEVKE